MVKNIIRVESLVVFLSTIFFYQTMQYKWIWFAILFFVPDIAIMFYMINKRVGSICYNIIHTYSIPIIGILINSLFFKMDFINIISLTFIAHISMDRFIGFGLKYPDDFKVTHIQNL